MITGRCYCGQVKLTAKTEPFTIAYCHCADCKRWTGAPLPAFAAFNSGEVSLSREIAGKTFSKGVKRWCCNACGSPLMAEFDYLPDQVYLPLGILDDAERLPPQLHCHGDAQFPWLHLNDDLPRSDGTARETLTSRSAQ